MNIPIKMCSLRKIFEKSILWRCNVTEMILTWMLMRSTFGRMITEWFGNLPSTTRRRTIQFIDRNFLMRCSLHINIHALKSVLHIFRVLTIVRAPRRISRKYLRSWVRIWAVNVLAFFFWVQNSKKCTYSDVSPRRRIPVRKIIPFLIAFISIPLAIWLLSCKSAVTSKISVSNVQTMITLDVRTLGIVIKRFVHTILCITCRLSICWNCRRTISIVTLKWCFHVFGRIIRVVLVGVREISGRVSVSHSGQRILASILENHRTESSRIISCL